MDFIETYDSVKDNKLKRSKLKDIGKVVIDKNGTTVAVLQRQHLELQIKVNKLEEELINERSKNLEIQSRLNDTNEILLKKYEKLENSINTLISISK
jgi:5'(3')-deoxyribonucleotidase